MASLTDTSRTGTGGRWSTAWWLAHCEGFRVQLDGELVGYVDDVVASDDPETADALTVGRLRVAAACVQSVDPAAERIVASSPAGKRGGATSTTMG